MENNPVRYVFILSFFHPFTCTLHAVCVFQLQVTSKKQGSTIGMVIQITSEKTQQKGLNASHALVVCVNYKYTLEVNNVIFIPLR